MKQILCSKRLFAALLSIAMLVCLVCVSPVRASAEGMLTSACAQDDPRSPAFPEAGKSTTSSDPKATGDNRPMELILASLGALSAMAYVAFLVDSKRRANNF